MAEQSSITRWIAEVGQGDSRAAAELWNRYYGRLVGLARRKLRDTPRRAADEEDVVVAAFNSFYRAAAAGRFPQLDDRDDLWQVLVMITARKAIDHLKHEHRQKRGGGKLRGESVFLQFASDQDRAAIDQVVGSEPSPEFAASIAEECRRLIDRLEDESLQTVAVAKMEGYSNEEIAQQLEVTTRTVERKLRYIREIWSTAD